MKLCLVALLLATTAQAAEPPTDAFPQIEVGRHTGPIRQLATDAAGRFVVTGSDDKTVRVWNPETFEQLSVIRVPEGAANVGQVFSVAITPDGRTIAAGGITDGQVVYLFDRASGKMLRRLTGAASAVINLAFTADGERLVAGELNGPLRFWHVRDGRTAGSNTDCTKGVFGLSIDRAGRLVTSCGDGQLRLYDAKATLITSAKAPSGQAPFGVQFSPDGSKIAVGYNDVPAIDVLSGKDLGPLYKPDMTGFSRRPLLKAVWSRDGKRLFGGGVAHVMRAWKDGDKKLADIDKGGNGIVTDLVAIPGGIAFSTDDPGWGVALDSGELKRFIHPAQPDFYRIGNGLLVSQDGLRVRFPTASRNKDPVEFDAATLTLHEDPKDDPALRPPKLTSPNAQFGDWRDAIDLRVNGKSIGLEKDIARTLAVAADGSAFIVGTEYTLNGYILPDLHRIWSRLVPGAPAESNISGDGRFVVTAYGDGTIRWQRLRDGEELAALFVHPENKRWVIFTPAGYYEASPGGEELIGWYQGQGPDQPGKLLPASEFREKFHRPDVIKALFRYMDLHTALYGFAKLPPRTQPQ